MDIVECPFKIKLGSNIVHRHTQQWFRIATKSHHIVLNHHPHPPLSIYVTWRVFQKGAQIKTETICVNHFARVNWEVLGYQKAMNYYVVCNIFLLLFYIFGRYLYILDSILLLKIWIVSIGVYVTVITSTYSRFKYSSLRHETRIRLNWNLSNCYLRIQVFDIQEIFVIDEWCIWYEQY